MKYRTKKNLIIFIIYIFLIFSMYLFYDWIEIFELRTIDNRFRIRKLLNNDHEFSEKIIFVNIDNYSKDKSGLAIWPKQMYADLINKTSQSEPEIIALDILFGTTNDTLGNKSVIDAVLEAGNIVNPYMVQFRENGSSQASEISSELYNAYAFDILPQVKGKDITITEGILYSPLQEIVEYSASMGFVNLQPDNDGVLRRIPLISNYNDRLILSFFLSSICSYFDYPLENIVIKNRYKLILKEFPTSNGKQNLTIPLDKNGNMLINYHDSIFDLNNFYSAWDFLQRGHPKLNLKKKLVLISDISSASKDHLPTPGNAALWNSYIFANAMNTILQENYIKSIDIESSSYIFILLLLYGILILINKFSGNFSYNIFSILLIILYILLNSFLFVYNDIILPFFPVVFPITGIFILTSLYKYFRSEKELAFLEGSLTSYLSPVLMEKIKKNDALLKIGGERKYITVLFSDIVNFTGFCDEADPAAVQDVLKEYFKVGVDLVFKNHGIVDKYLGDGLLAFFENDDNTIQSQVSAVKCAIDFQKTAVELKKYFDKRMDFEFKIRIGIATGYAKVGNIGPEQKIDYTIIGSVVNLASRLEGVGNPGEITIDEWTKRELPEDIKCLDCGDKEIKGYKNPVKVYKIVINNI